MAFEACPGTQGIPRGRSGSGPAAYVAPATTLHDRTTGTVSGRNRAFRAPGSSVRNHGWDVLSKSCIESNARIERRFVGSGDASEFSDFFVLHFVLGRLDFALAFGGCLPRLAACQGCGASPRFRAPSIFDGSRSQCICQSETKLSMNRPHIGCFICERSEPKTGVLKGRHISARGKRGGRPPGPPPRVDRPQILFPSPHGGRPPGLGRGWPKAG
jgi:hypothetical protein